MKKPSLIFMCITMLCLQAIAQGGGLTRDSAVLINVNPDPSGEPWIAGGLSVDQQQALLSLPELIVEKPHHATALPSKVDNTKFASFRPIFNQVGGSCSQASTVGYVFTYEIDFLRGAAASMPEAQYPYGYTFDFLNNGSASNGTSTDQGWTIIQYNGIPTVKDFGAISGTNSSTEWVSGYEKYYEGMSSRTSTQFTIGVKPDSGMLKMKRWLFDHANGAAQGGCLIFTGNAANWSLKKLPTGSSDAGFSCITSMGTSGGHAMTIAGYNDSVYYDINGNGTIEANERGAALMVNSWGTSFGSTGKAYLMYDVMRRTTGGSIDGNKVMGVNVIKNTIPKITFKVNLTHNSRNQIKITAGVSTNTSATVSSGTPIGFGNSFNYSGGSLPLCGSGASSTLEAGFDVSPLANTIGSAKSAKLFLIISSKGGTGQVNSFSVMDYRGESPVEIPCSETNVTIKAGSSFSVGTTYLSAIIGPPSSSDIVYNTGKAFSAGMSIEYRNSQLYYQVPKRNASEVSRVTISLFNAQGKLMHNYVNEKLSPGFYSVDFNTQLLARGIYLCSMEVMGLQKAITINVK